MSLEQTQSLFHPSGRSRGPAVCRPRWSLPVQRHGGGGTEDTDRQGEGLVLHSLNISGSQVSWV